MLGRFGWWWAITAAVLEWQLPTQILEWWGDQPGDEVHRPWWARVVLKVALLSGSRPTIDLWDGWPARIGREQTEESDKGLLLITHQAKP